RRICFPLATRPPETRGEAAVGGRPDNVDHATAGSPDPARLNGPAPEDEIEKLCHRDLPRCRPELTGSAGKVNAGGAAAQSRAQVGWKSPAGDRVKISQPSSVTPTACSNWAESERSRV